jgi:Arc/MetJ-type ribon-helix-helix transcriptional regulator
VAIRLRDLAALGHCRGAFDSVRFPLTEWATPELVDLESKLADLLRVDRQKFWPRCFLAFLPALAYHPVGWYRLDMAEVDKTEKITINLGLVDLGQIDLLVQEGFFVNRTDFIRTAIRTQLASRAAAVNQSVARRTLVLGTQHYTRRDLEELRDAGQTVHIRVLGLASIADDVSAQLARATIVSVEVLGAFRASVAVKAALAGRIV